MPIGDVIENTTQTSSAAENAAPVIESVTDEVLPPENTVTQADIDAKLAKAEKAEADVLKSILKQNGEYKPKDNHVPSIDGDTSDEDDEDPQPKASAKPSTKDDGNTTSNVTEADRLAFARAKFTPEEAEDYRAKYGEERYAKRAGELRKMQADADRAFAIAKGQSPEKPILLSTAPRAEAFGADSAEATSQGTPAASPDAAELDRLITESFDEDAATKIRAALSSSRGQHEQAEQARLALAQQMVNQRFESAQSALSDKLPGLSDPANLPKLREYMHKLDPTGEALNSQGEFNALASQAYYAAFGHKISADARASLIAENKKVVKGQPTVGQRASNRATGNKDDFERDVLKVIERTKHDPSRQESELRKVRSAYGK